MAEKKKKHKKLNARQKKFVAVYLETYNATQAAKEAGYKGKSDSVFRSIGSQNLTKLNIKEEISKQTADMGMGANEVLARLATMARGFDISDYIEQVETYAINRDGSEYFAGYEMKVDFAKLQRDGHSHLIKKVRSTGKCITIEWHDAKDALIQLGKNHRLFIDKFEFEGTIATSTPEAVDALQKAKKELGSK